MVKCLNIGSRLSVFIVIGLLAGIYLILNLLLPELPVSINVKTYVIQPLIWGGLACLILFLFPKYRPAAKPSRRNRIIKLALVIGLFQIILYTIGGLFSGFGQSPYSFSPKGIVTNIFFTGSALIGIEVSRAWLINRMGKHHIFWSLAFVTLLYTLLDISIIRLTSFNSGIETITFLGSVLLPALVASLLATMLARLSGPLPAIAYMGILQAFWWFCPILPDLQWTFKGLIGTLVPITGIVIINSFYSSSLIGVKPKKRATGRFPVGWLVTAVTALLLVWFSVGLFPFRPTLVLSGSMRPEIEVGDVLISTDVEADAIKVGDIIQFINKDEVIIMHRVVGFVETDGPDYFITKGDDNDSPDIEPVNPDNVLGKVVYNIPKIGWIGISIKELFN